MKPLIQKLVETPGPSGSENKIREVIRSEVASYADEIRVDGLGNLIVRKGQKAANNQRIMLSGHMDEIGVMATHIDENGFIRFITIGGVRPHTCLGGRVIFMDGTRGVIGAEKLENMEKVNTLDQLFIDIGATSRETCPIKIGSVAGFERPFLDLGNRLVAKSMDDRISCAVMIEALRTMSQTPNEIDFVFSVQEEVGIRGATTAAFGVDPDFGLAVDVTDVGDTPKGSRMEVSLGKGVAIKVQFELYC